MNDRELARTTCFERMEAFGTAHIADFAANPADASDLAAAKTKARAKFTALAALNVSIDQDIGKQQSGAHKAGTTNRGVLRDALTLDLREWNRTAAGLADELHRPEIMDGFRIPHGHNDEMLAGRARAFIQAIADMDLHDHFVDSGMPDNFEVALDAAVEMFEGSQEQQSEAGQKIVGAGKDLETLVRTGMGIRKSLDALVHNLFKGNAAVIGEWASASHVERQAKTKQTPPPTPPTP